MSLELARQVADAILFEGYVLYPYRASAQKNQARWQFGVLAIAGSDEPTASQTEFLVEGLPDGWPTSPAGAGELDVLLRFLQVQTRYDDPSWDEGVVREVPVRVPLHRAAAGEVVHQFGFDGAADIQDTVSRRRWPLRGSVAVRATPLEGPYGLARVRVRVTNESTGDSYRRPHLLRHCLVAAHSLISMTDGSLVSMLEPPEWAAPAVARCVNEHTWPVLVGAGDVMLSSPIILYDHPEIAPESVGDMCDATEMDEMLVLRTLTLTDEEKRAARETDERSAAILDQVEGMPPELLERLHGAIRYLRRVEEPLKPPAEGTPWWDPGADRSVSPETDRVRVPGGDVGRGSKVRLRPRQHGTDAQDMFLTDRVATVQAVVSDVDGSTHLAVALDDDPAAELHAWYGRYLYFLPTEVELVAVADPA